MQIIKIIAYVCFGLAFLIVILAIGSEEFSMIYVSITVAIMGVLLLALDTIISTLVEIRDAVVGAGGKATEATAQSTSVNQVENAKPARSVQEISADLERLKSKL